MFKRFFLAFGLIVGLLSPSFAAGTIPFSLSQQLDNFGKPLGGCKFYTIQAGTTSTPQNAFQDSALTLPLPNPQTCDASGRLPQMFLADGSIKVRLIDKNGVTVIVADNIQVIGNSSGGGGGSPVDPTTVLTTGDIKASYGTGVVTGFVRLNGRTIGSATSGATERANADTQALFQYLWNVDQNLQVSTGRGASANADWVANKQITLPDFRGRVVAGLDDMGNSAAGRLTSSFNGFGSNCAGVANATTLGVACGFENRTLLLGNLPPITPAGTVSTSVIAGENNAIGIQNPPINPNNIVGVGGTANGGSITKPPLFVATSTFTGTPIGGTSTPFASVQPTILTTYYVKL